MEYAHRYRYLRWLVLLIVLINSLFNTLYDVLHIPGNSVKEVSDTYKTLFTPAGYAFAIWGIIYLSFIIYAIYQLLPAQRMVRFFDRMAGLVITANLLCMAWQVAFRNNLIGGSVAVILITLGVAVAMQVMVRRETHNNTTWLTVPFSLFLGWICVATIANIASWLVASGWEGGALAPETWAIIMLLVAFIAGIILSLAYHDFLIPLVLAWALTAIYVSVLHIAPSVANTALVSGIVSALWSIGVFLHHQKESFMIGIHHHTDA